MTMTPLYPVYRCQGKHGDRPEDARYYEFRSLGKLADAPVTMPCPYPECGKTATLVE